MALWPRMDVSKAPLVAIQSTNYKIPNFSLNLFCSQVLCPWIYKNQIGSILMSTIRVGTLDVTLSPHHVFRPRNV